MGAVEHSTQFCFLFLYYLVFFFYYYYLFNVLNMLFTFFLQNEESFTLIKHKRSDGIHRTESLWLLYTNATLTMLSQLNPIAHHSWHSKRLTLWTSTQPSGPPVLKTMGRCCCAGAGDPGGCGGLAQRWKGHCGHPGGHHVQWVRSPHNKGNMRFS